MSFPLSTCGGLSLCLLVLPSVSLSLSLSVFLFFGGLSVVSLGVVDLSIRDFLISILGSYEPVTYQVYDAATEAYVDVVAAGFAGVDWLYVGTLALLVVVIYCVLKCLGGLICKIF